jgi:8-oxo-dGTP pyrophosphatase MutT (NUDIX family)
MPPIPAADLTCEALRRWFSAADAGWVPEIVSDHDPAVTAPPREAAVLMPLVDLDGLGHLLLTTRPTHLRSHSGQIALPGGRVEPGDPDRIATALREANEEIGLHYSDVEVLGSLPEYRTASGYAVTPVVGWLAGLPELVPDPAEVDEVFLVPLSFLMDPRNHHRLRMPSGMAERSVYAMPWQAPNDRVEYFIWGVTAAILRNFYQFLRSAGAQAGAGRSST